MDPLITPRLPATLAFDYVTLLYKLIPSNIIKYLSVRSICLTPRAIETLDCCARYNESPRARLFYFFLILQLLPPSVISSRARALVQYLRAINKRFWACKNLRASPFKLRRLKGNPHRFFTLHLTILSIMQFDTIVCAFMCVRVCVGNSELLLWGTTFFRG